MEKQKLPFAQKSLTFGIISIITSCCCLGLPGLILGYLGYTNSKKAIDLYEQNPDAYDSVGNAKTGKIVSIIGLVLGAIFLLQVIYSIATGSFQEQIETFKQQMEQIQSQQ